MVDTTGPSLATFYLAAKYLYVILFGLWVYAVYRRPRPWTLVAGSVLSCFYVYAAIEVPLRRPYALTPGTDRMFNVAMAATAATGHSPLESYQVGQGDHEPLWRWLMARASAGSPENVLYVYRLLTPATILLLALSLFLGLPERSAADSGGDGKWELALVVYAVLLLNSSPYERFGVFESFWPMTLLLKPNHVLGFVLIPLWVRAFTSRHPSARNIVSAVLLALLSWVFLLHWAYLMLGLALYPFVSRWLGHPPEWRRAWITGAVSAVAAVPYVVFLFANFPPDASVVGRLVWESTRAFQEGYWNLFSVGYEHGFLFLLSLSGIWSFYRRRQPLDVVWLSLLSGCLLGWLGYLLAFQLRKTIEPEEFYFFTRFVLSVAAGYGAWHAITGLSRLLERPRVPQTLCLVLGATLPLTFPYWWDPPKMDRYFARSLSPIPGEVERLSDWVRERTGPDSVFVASPAMANWIAALSGRRVLLTGDHRPPRDYEHRAELLSQILTIRSREVYRQASELYSVSHIVIDQEFQKSFEIEPVQFEVLPWLETVYRDDSLEVFELRLTGGNDAPPSGDAR